MNPAHALRHLQELRARVPFLRALRPGNSTYLMWIGDIAEFANTTWGIGSPQPLRLASVLRPHSGDDQSATDDEYRARVSAVDAVLAGYEEELRTDPS
jgi:hypothetical protein